MPYSKEHAARVKSPGAFRKGTIRSKTIDKGLRIIIGRLRTPQPGKRDNMVTQAYRFARNVFTVKQAREWLKKNEIKPLTFEAASAVGE